MLALQRVITAKVGSTRQILLREIPSLPAPMRRLSEGVSRGLRRGSMQVFSLGKQAEGQLGSSVSKRSHG